jgi:hypothetical protein
MVIFQSFLYVYQRLVLLISDINKVVHHSESLPQITPAYSTRSHIELVSMVYKPTRSILIGTFSSSLFFANFKKDVEKTIGFL